jgi:hypothetical protein
VRHLPACHCAPVEGTQRRQGAVDGRRGALVLDEPVHEALDVLRADLLQPHVADLREYAVSEAVFVAADRGGLVAVA